MPRNRKECLVSISIALATRYDQKKKKERDFVKFFFFFQKMPEEALQAKSGFGKTVDVIRGTNEWFYEFHDLTCFM